MCAKNLNRTTIRPFILITFSHCERRNLSQSDVLLRFQTLYTCNSIIVSQEPHKAEGFHYHVGLWTRNASKNNFRKVIRAAFPEFEGRQIDVQARKGFGPICHYITKVDKSPLIWGEYDLGLILKKASASEKRKRGFIKEQNLTPSGVNGVNKKKRKLPFWFSRVTWILLLSLSHYAFNLEIPPLFLFLGNYLSFLKQYMVQLWEELWEELGDETLPKADSSWEEVLPSILLIVGCAAFFIITSILRPEE